MRILAISDLHVDHQANMRWVINLSNADYQDDILIVAGDISDDKQKFKTALAILRSKFQTVLFVPGNHDLWVRKDKGLTSLQKFYNCLNICATLDIQTERVSLDHKHSLTIQPIFSWYEKPEEGDGSLYFPKKGDDPELSMWMDNQAIRWPELEGIRTAEDFFSAYSARELSSPPADQILTFSHFIPRQELIFPADYVPGRKYPGYHDAVPTFNFSRVAGSKKIDEQIRAIHSSYHIYGHQHRNRFRQINGVSYLSHNLGYPKERKLAGIEDNAYFPRLIWDNSQGFMTYKEA